LPITDLGNIQKYQSLLHIEHID